MRMSASPIDAKVAVLLNANAKRVSRDVHTALRHVVPENDLFLSRTAGDARTIARTVVERGYRTVFTGGGDGTFVSFVTEILKRTVGLARSPRFGVLKLGTGNALAGMVGATAGEGILDDVLRARAGEVPNVRRIDLIEADGRLTPFCGVGLDGALLNDYVAMKKRLNHGPLKRLAAGGAAYALAIAGKTAPYYLMNRRSPELEVVNAGGEATLFGLDGKVARKFGPGEVLFRGRANMCSAGTIPFYGFNFKMFPYAGTQTGKLNLRISDLSVVQTLSHLDEIWQGKFRHPAISDFLADRVIVRSETKLPFQIGGDAEGYRDHLELGVAQRSVELVDFTASLN